MIIEDRLRDAYRGAADTVRPDDLRGLEEQTAVISYPVRPARQRWLAPAAASAAAAAVVIALAVVVPDALRGMRDNNGQVAGAGGDPATHFIVAISGSRAKYLTVHRVGTGALVSNVVAVPARVSFTAAATGDGRTYVASSSVKGTCGSQLLKFTISRHGQAGPLLQPRGGHLNQDVTQIAISANGKILALAGTKCGSGTAVLSALSLVSGHLRQWPLAGPSGVTSLSLTGGGDELAYSRGTGVYVLPTSAAPGPAAKRGRTVLEARKYGADARITSATISPDGRVIYFGTSVRSPRQNTWALRSVRVSTGRVRQFTFVRGYVGNVAINPAVTEAIVFVRPPLGPYPTPTPTPSASVPPSGTATPTPSQSAQPGGTPTPTPWPTATPTPSASPSRSGWPSGSPTPVPSSPSPAPSGSPVPTPVPSVAASLTAYRQAGVTVLKISLSRGTIAVEPAAPWHVALNHYVW
jgi:hypothetical protein